MLHSHPLTRLLEWYHRSLIIAKIRSVALTIKLIQFASAVLENELSCGMFLCIGFGIELFLSLREPTENTRVPDRCC